RSGVTRGCARSRLTEETEGVLMRRIVIVVAVVGSVLGLSAGPALAHGEYVSPKGDVAILTGFATEPAYINQPNAVQLEISHAGKAVTDLKPGDLAVKVEVA